MGHLKHKLKNKAEVADHPVFYISPAGGLQGKRMADEEHGSSE